jgi:hypothetical protein
MLIQCCKNTLKNRNLLLLEKRFRCLKVTRKEHFLCVYKIMDVGYRMKVLGLGFVP